MGFSSWSWDFAEVQKLQTVASCDCLDPMIYLLVVTSFHWVIQIVWSHVAVGVSLWEDVSTSKSTDFSLFWRCFGLRTVGADGAAVLLLSLAKCAALEEHSESWCVTVFENFFCLVTGRSSISICAAWSQQTPGSSWEKPGGWTSKRHHFASVLAGKCCCTMGFSSWTWDFAKVEKLQTVGSCELLGTTCLICIMFEWYISWLSPVSTEWFRLSGHILLSEFHFEKMFQHLKADWVLPVLKVLRFRRSARRWGRRAPPFLGQMRSAGGTFWVVMCDCLCELLLSCTRKELNLDECGKIPADAWKQLGEARWVNLKKASFRQCLGRKMLLHDGFQFVDLRLCKSWETSDSRELWVTWYYMSYLHHVWMIYQLAFTSLHWVIQIVWVHFAVRVSLWEDVSTSKSTEFSLFWRCFGSDTGADGATVLLLSLAKCAALEEHSELWRVTVFENFFCLETRRSLICVAAGRSQQTPGSSWEKPGGWTSKRHHFAGVLAGKCCCTMGFSSWTWDFAEVEKLQTVGSCE